MACSSVIGLVILSPEQWQKHYDAPIKIDFYLRQLAVLKQQLATLNIPLIVKTIDLWKDIPDFIHTVMNALRINSIHANIECGVNELHRDFAVQQQLNQHGQDLILHHDRNIFPAGSIRNKNKMPYQVFSAFKNTVMNN